MIKILFRSIAIISVLLMSSCLSGPEKKANYPEEKGKKISEISSLMFDLTPSDGMLYFFTVITREQYREKEVESCREEAARQLSRYFQINGVTYNRTTQSTQGTNIREASGIAFNDERARALTEEMELILEIQTDEGTAALFSYRKGSVFSLPYKPGKKDGAPDWISNSIRIPGYQTAVGFTGPRRFFERTMKQADKNALATLLEQRKGSLNITQKDWETDFGSAAASQSIEKAAGSVNQAYILSRWIDSKGNFYSLAVCPAP